MGSAIVVGIVFVLVACQIWRANKKWMHAEKLVRSAESRIKRGESALTVGAETAAFAQAKGCEEEVKLVWDERADELPDFTRIWNDGE